MSKPPRPLASVGQRIRARRMQLGMSRAAFAQAAGVTESSIARIEGGKEVRASTYLAVVGYLQRRHACEDVGERVALLTSRARAQVLELIHHFEKPS